MSTTTEPIPAAESSAASSASGGGDALPLWAFALTIAASLGIGLVLFVALPNLIAYHALKDFTRNRVTLNVAEGMVKLAIFVAYVWMVGKRPNIRRVFEYHGAEHKVVYAVENHRPITPAGARPFDTPHPRCGTGFALLTVVVSVFCFAFLPVLNSSLANVAMRFVLMPLVAGISYEIIKLTTHPRLGRFVVWLMTPGMWLQRLTTHQPDDAQLEVSCAAMRAVLEAENKRPA